VVGCAASVGAGALVGGTAVGVGLAHAASAASVNRTMSVIIFFILLLRSRINLTLNPSLIGRVDILDSLAHGERAGVRENKKPPLNLRGGCIYTTRYQFSLRPHYRYQVQRVGDCKPPSQPGVTELPGDILDFGFWISDFGFWILDFGFWILDFGFWILDFGFRISDFGFWISDFGFRILDFGFWILDFGFRILDFRFSCAEPPIFALCREMHYQ
jgi:hypothetical protein